MRFNSRAEICTLRSQTYSFSTTPHFWLYLPNAEMTLDLEVNEVEVKVLTSLASVTWITGSRTEYQSFRLWSSRQSSDKHIVGSRYLLFQCRVITWSLLCLTLP